VIETGSDENKLANELFEKKRQGNMDTNSMAMEALNVDASTSFI
jgi:hypothetical protein